MKSFYFLVLLFLLAACSSKHRSPASAEDALIEKELAAIGTDLREVQLAGDELNLPNPVEVEPVLPVAVTQEVVDSNNIGTYQVQAQDTLMLIAFRIYGDPSRWHEIYDLNKDLLSTPDALVAGQSIRLCIP